MELSVLSPITNPARFIRPIPEFRFMCGTRDEWLSKLKGITVPPYTMHKKVYTVGAPIGEPFNVIYYTGVVRPEDRLLIDKVPPYDFVNYPVAGIPCVEWLEYCEESGHGLYTLLLG